jgi:type I restriction enzyme S subunit
MKPTTNEILPEGYKITELGPLPEEWKVVRVLDYCNFDRGTEPGSESYNREGEGVIFIRVGNISAGLQELLYTKSDNIKLCNEEDILMSFDGSPGIVTKGFKGAYSSGIRKVTPKTLNLDKNFLFYILKTKFVQDVIEKYKTGITIKHASKSIQHIKIPLPPLSEQQKIAAVLTAVQEAKEKTQAVIDATKVLKKSMMKHLFTYGPVPPEETENVPLKETEIGKVPEDWKVVFFEKCIKKEPIKVGKVKQQEYKVYGKYPIVDQGKSLIAGYCDYEKYVYEGTLPVIIFGDHTRIIKFINFPFVIGADGTKVLTPNASVVLPEFFYFALLNIKIPNRGYNRHYSLLREQKIPLPPLFVQQKIASILSAIDAKIEAEENKKQALEDLFKTLLHNLMTAKIRVTAIHDLP